MERTLILVKPDAFARNLTGEIIARFERKGLRLAALKQMTMTTELAEQHYAEHAEKPFFGELASFITSGPLVAMVLEGDRAIEAARQVIGATDPLKAVARLDPRRLRGRGWPEHGSRLRRARVRGARGRPVLPRARLGPAAMATLILASRSPQRRAILEQLGVQFEVRIPDVDELETGPPHEVAIENAYRKAAAAVTPGRRAAGSGGRHDRQHRLADLGQTRRRSAGDRHAACAAGRRHAVISGVCVIAGGQHPDRGGDHRGSVPFAGRCADRLVPGQRRMARARRRIRDPRARCGAGGGDRGRLHERRRPSGTHVARAGAVAPARRPVDMKAALRPASGVSSGWAANAFAYAGFPAYFGSLKRLARSHGRCSFGYTHRSDGAGSLGVGSNT